MGLFSRSEEKKDNRKSTGGYLDLLKRSFRRKKNVRDEHKYRSSNIDRKIAGAYVAKGKFSSLMESINRELQEEFKKSPSSIDIEKIGDLQEQFKVAEKIVAGIETSIDNKRYDKKNYNIHKNERIVQIKQKDTEAIKSKAKGDFRKLKNSARGKYDNSKGILSSAIGSVRDFIDFQKAKFANNKITKYESERNDVQISLTKKQDRLDSLMQKHSSIKKDLSAGINYFKSQSEAKEIEREAKKLLNEISNLQEQVKSCNELILSYA